jgi:hypothetical protein
MEGAQLLLNPFRSLFGARITFFVIQINQLRTWVRSGAKAMVFSQFIVKRNKAVKSFAALTGTAKRYALVCHLPRR